MKNQVKKVAEKALGEGFYNKVVLPKHYGVAVATNVRKGFPARNLQVIGVTGTNGKTSTCYMIHRMLHEAGYKPGLLSTVAYGVGDDLQPQIHHMTSQPIGLLMDRIQEMKGQGMDILVFEVTSHALAQFRTMGVPIDIAVMTNLTHEHLDYHGSFEAYRDAKVKLFKAANKHKSGHQIGIVNADDDNALYFAEAVKNPMAYSLKDTKDPAVSHPRNLKLTPSGSTYSVEILNPKYETAKQTRNSKEHKQSQEKIIKLDITCNIPGSYNVANSLAAASVGVALGIDAKTISKGIAALKDVEGRMTTIDEGQDFTVIVDFAHTPDSFEKLFKDLRPVVKGRLISLFGSAGRRDVAKRAVQGEIAGKYSDIVFVTEEDDRDVDGNKIMDQIAKGAEKAGKSRGKNLHLILDRETAIKKALKTAKKGDTVVLLGKGHEKTIERADGEHPWDEITLVKKLLKK